MDESTSHVYPIKYKIEFGKFTKKDLREGDWGGCDGLGIISVMGKFGSGEDMSQAKIGIWPNNGNWSDEDWYRAIEAIAAELSNSANLPVEARKTCQYVLERARAMRGL